MRVFLTGATGFIGSAIVQELIGAGHQVLGLARSDAAAKSACLPLAPSRIGVIFRIWTACGVEPPPRMASIHTGFIHDFSRFKEVCEVDERAIEALGSALAGSDRPLIVTSGTALLPPGRLATEEDVRPSRLKPRSPWLPKKQQLRWRPRRARVGGTSSPHRSMATAITASFQF